MSKTRVDEITLATVWHDMLQTCHDMGHTVERTAQNYILTELHDLSVGIWDASARTVVVPPIGLAVHFLTGSFTLEGMSSKFKGDIYPGDVFLVNDPYHGGHNCHLPDWGFFRPIFYRDELVFWTLVRGHMQDTGGSFPGGYFPGGYDVHAEGLCIPPIKVVERGTEKRDVLGLIWNNVRFPDGIKIDNYSMIASTKLCEHRLIRLMDKYGRDVILDCIEEMIARTERAVRAEIAKMPDGVYYGEAATDDDGTVLDVPVTIRCDLTIKGDEAILDFSRSDGQRKGFVNGIYATTYANSMAAMMLVLGSELAEFHNEGTRRPIRVIAREGSVVNCVYPAPQGASPIAISIPVIEAVLQAFAQAVPDRAIAAAGRHRVPLIFGNDPRSNRQYFYPTMNPTGSLGAVNAYDGHNGVMGLHARGAITRGNVEEEEIRFPWRMLKYEFATDLMGGGKFRGGWGIHHEMIHEGTDGYLCTGGSDGDVACGHGALGGQPPLPSRTYIRRGNEEIRVKSHRLVPLEPNDVLMHFSSGGGGVGDPSERSPEKVLDDVRNEVVSLETARNIYKVWIDPKSLEIDWGKTQALRAAEEPQGNSRQAEGGEQAD